MIAGHRDGSGRPKGRRKTDLEHELRQLRSRVKMLEAAIFALAGIVRIQGVPHLLECEMRTTPEADCTCGSLPAREQAMRRAATQKTKKSKKERGRA